MPFIMAFLIGCMKVCHMMFEHLLISVVTASVIILSCSMCYFNIEEVLSSNYALWWSPDGRHILFITFNDSQVHTTVIVKVVNPHPSLCGQGLQYLPC